MISPEVPISEYSVSSFLSLEKFDSWQSHWKRGRIDTLLTLGQCGPSGHRPPRAVENPQGTLTPPRLHSLQISVAWKLSSPRQQSMNTCVVCYYMTRSSVDFAREKKVL